MFSSILSVYAIIPIFIILYSSDYLLYKTSKKGEIMRLETFVLAQSRNPDRYEQCISGLIRYEVTTIGPGGCILCIGCG